MHSSFCELNRACQDLEVDIVLKNILEFHQIVIVESCPMIWGAWVVVEVSDLNFEAAACTLSRQDVEDNCRLPFTLVSSFDDQDIDAKPGYRIPLAQSWFLGSGPRYGARHR